MKEMEGKVMRMRMRMKSKERKKFDGGISENVK